MSEGPVEILIMQPLPGTATDWLTEQGALLHKAYEDDSWRDNAEAIRALIYYSIPVDKPQAASTTPIKEESVVIAITADERIYYGGREIGMDFGSGLGRVLDRARRGRAPSQPGRLANQPVELGVRGQVGDRLELAELAHRIGIGGLSAKLLPAPEVERRMSLERRHHQQDFAVEGEGRRAPFEGLLDLGKRGVDPLADALEDRARERLRPGDIGIDPGVEAQRIPPPSIRRTMPMTMTNRLRLRPVFEAESMPTTAPMIASGMISQLAQPRKGMKATIAKTIAAAPMISETRFNISRS